MKYSAIMFFAILLFVSCSDDGVTKFISLEDASSGVLVKKIYTMEMDQLLNIEDYEYNNRGKLSKLSYYGGNRGTLYYYEIYNYDVNGKLINIIEYDSNIYSPTGFLLLDSTVFSYSGDLCVSKRIIHPQANIFEEIKYEYEGALLKTELYYDNNRYMYKKVYEYNKGRIENLFTYNSNGDLSATSKYKYEGSYITEILNYASNDELLTKTSYAYNANGKLEKEIREVVAMYLSTMSYVVLYEY